MSWIITGTQRYQPAALLDQFPGAAAAYSLRNLVGTSNPAVVRVRRDSDNTEQDFTATEVSDGTLAAWVGAGNNGFVRIWYDQSGNARNAEQANTASQPTVVASGSVVPGGLLFNGSSSHLIADSLSSVFSGANRALSYFGVSQTAIAATYQPVLDGRNSINSNPIQAPFAYRATNSNYFQQRRNDNGDLTNNGIGSYAVTLNLSQLVTSLMGPGELRVNGTQLLLQPLVGGQVTIDRVSIGARAEQGFDFLNGKIAEILVYPADQSANKVAIESSINAHYNIF